MVAHGVTLLLRPILIEVLGDQLPPARLAHIGAIGDHLVEVIETCLLRHHHRAHAEHVLWNECEILVGLSVGLLVPHVRVVDTNYESFNL